MVRWIEGAPEEAIQQSRTSIGEAQQLGHQLTLSLALWTGCQVALWVGDVAALERSTASLLDHTERHSLENYHAYGLGFAGELSALRGDIDAGLRLMRAGLDGLLRHQNHVRYWVFLGSLAKLTAAAGNVADGLVMIDDAVERAERSSDAWYTPELLRIKAELLLSQGEVATSEAEAYLARSLAMARGQGALSWELRSAMSLARHRWQRDQAGSARELLQSVYGRFTEGFETADLQAARGLLQQLA
jgi:predicted ATPase